MTYLVILFKTNMDMGQKHLVIKICKPSRDACDGCYCPELDPDAKRSRSLSAAVGNKELHPTTQVRCCRTFSHRVKQRGSLALSMALIVMYTPWIELDPCKRIYFIYSHLLEGTWGPSKGGYACLVPSQHLSGLELTLASRIEYE